MSNNWFITTCRAFILTAFICFTIGIFGNSEVSTNGYITAYSISIVVILLLLSYVAANLVRGSGNTSLMVNVFSLFTDMGPFVFMLAILSLVLYDTFKFKTNIIQNNVGNDYIWYSESIIFIVMLQLMLIYMTISDDTFERMNKLSTLASSILYLLCVLSLTSYIPFHNILNYYSTDGFSTLF